MMKNPMINGAIDDFKYKDFLSVDDVLVKEESFANPNLGELQLFNEQDFFAEFPNSSSHSHEAESNENSDIHSDLVMDYISQMLMEEDMDDKFDMLESNPALEATEKPFYEIIGEKYPPSDRPPLYSSLSSESSESHRNHNLHSSAINGVMGFADINSDLAYPETATLFHSRIYSSQTSISSEYGVASFLEGFEGGSDDFSDLLFKTLPTSQFEKGVQEAIKFLPSEDKLVADASAIGFYTPHELNGDLTSIEDRTKDARGRRQKGRHDINFDLEEQRNSKQSAISYEEPSVSSEMFDMVLLCSHEKLPKVITTIREAMKNEAASKNSSEITELKESGKGRRSRNKKKQPQKEVVDFHTLLLQCAQTIASGHHHRAYELLRQIRQHSSPQGDAWQRVAHYFADGLEARLAGTGSVIYNAVVSKRKTASDVLKAYQLYLAASPLKMVPYHFSNQTILNAIGNATRVHILDYGIYFGFQWPPFLKMLSFLPGGPPKLRITGIDVPQPGFRPEERIEETGRRLHHYAERFRIPFEYHVVASKLDEVQIEDLHLEEEEVLIVNCVFRLNSLGDETMDADCPRDKFLNNIRKLNPALFVNVTSNGSFGTPFFLTRFREALYYFSALFDMLEMTVPREHEQRMLVERDLYGKYAINVISCEGADRSERPETYKQTQVRYLRAGFEQLSISSEITKMVKCKVRVHYHKDFSVDEDGQWLLLGWRGRIFIGLSAWKPIYC